jgi:hypothetical protein
MILQTILYVLKGDTVSNSLPFFHKTGKEVSSLSSSIPVAPSSSDDGPGMTASPLLKLCAVSSFGGRNLSRAGFWEGQEQAQNIHCLWLNFLFFCMVASNCGVCGRRTCGEQEQPRA